MTMRELDKIGVPYTVVIEESDYVNYAAVIDKSKLLVMPSHGSGVVTTRNWIWGHAAKLGVRRYWSMDDNIEGFFRFNRNLKTPVSSGTILKCIEDFTDRYANIPISGMNYFMFVIRKSVHPPYILNTRVYSNMLIQTDACDPIGKPYRFEGFYNEDTDLCLRMLKDGFCTILFNAFLIKKYTTMRIKGGNTPNYQGDGRWKMAEELQRKHPDVTRIGRRWDRWQHCVDYRSFKNNRPIKKQDTPKYQGVDNYGMKLKEGIKT